MLRRSAFLLTALVALTSAAVAQTTHSTEALAARIDAVFDASAFDNARWGAYAIDAETGEVIYARDPAGHYIPASNMKLVTTAAALDELGPDYRFRTRLYIDGAVRGGVLQGALVVRGSGDPRFGGRHSGGDLARAFRAWADSLKSFGIRTIDGPVILADDAIEDPDTYVIRTMKGAMRQEGIEFASGEVRVYSETPHPDYTLMRQVAVHASPRLANFVDLTNTDSNNLYAERILRTLAVEMFPGDGPVHPVLRSRAADGVLARAGIDPQSFTVADGSGLSHDNRLTPIGTVALLQWMWDHPHPATRQAFYESLPLGGYTGTLKSRYSRGDARGNVRAKTGYVRRVRTLSGYVTTANDRTIVFSLMCNGYTVRTSRVNRAQDEVVELLADYAGRSRVPTLTRTSLGMAMPGGH